jgi:hypothetical protein
MTEDFVEQHNASALSKLKPTKSSLYWKDLQQEQI